MSTREFFSIEATDDEAEFGFALRASPNGHFAMAAVLGHGLLAVKIRAPDDRVEYQVCDDALAPLYMAASSLAELRERFRTKCAPGHRGDHRDKPPRRA